MAGSSSGVPAFAEGELLVHDGQQLAGFDELACWAASRASVAAVTAVARAVSKVSFIPTF